MKKIKIATIFGTRPEVIKLASFIKAVEEDPTCTSITCSTTQHRDLQNEVLSLFQIQPDYDLDIMINGQDLFHITNIILDRIKHVLDKENPDYLVVQGDTTTAFSAALAGFYKKIPIVHIEAGLRTGNIYRPFPEEMNRSLISRLTTLHMAPTQEAVDNLHNEGIIQNVFKVGNTIVDSVQWVLQNCPPKNEFIKEKINSPEKKILITVHRRENLGAPLINICDAIKELCILYPSDTFIWPLHPNPSVQSIVFNALNGLPNLHLIKALSYSDLLPLIKICSFIISDSGGIQEESCILGKRIIILREETERTEVVKSGLGVLVGSNKEKIITYFKDFVTLCETFPKKGNINHIYGLPGVSKNILSKIKVMIQNNELFETDVND
jgi:UDP-N-acetylglucosamine 2-epimerase (non-hydrolysing)